MRRNAWIAPAFLATALALAPGAARAEDAPAAATPPAATEEAPPPETQAREIDRNDRVGVGTPVRVGPDEIVAGDVVGVGTRVVIEGTVRGDVVGIGSRVEIRGQVRGQVVGVGSNLEIAPGASVGGQVVNVMGSLDSEGAQVGEIVDISPGIAIPALGGVPFGILGFFGLWWKLLVVALVFVVLLLHTALVPDRVRVISEETPVRPVVAFLVGLLGYAALFVVSFFLAVTLVGIPLVFLLYFVFKILQWLGFAGIFHHVGRRIGAMFGRDLSVLGAVLLGFLPFAVLRFLPFCTGWFLWFLLEIVAIGFVILTRAGTRGTAGGEPAAMAVAAAPPAAATPEVAPE
jgi:hypothetical protein